MDAPYLAEAHAAVERAVADAWADGHAVGRADVAGHGARAAALAEDNARLLAHLHSAEARLELAEDTIRSLTRAGR